MVVVLNNAPSPFFLLCPSPPRTPQVVDEEDFLEELVSKLRRRKRQAAGNEEIGAIMEERLQVRARHAALRSVKLSELKGATKAFGRRGGGRGGVVESTTKNGPFVLSHFL